MTTDKIGEIKISGMYNGKVVFHATRGTGRRACVCAIEIVPTGSLNADVARAALAAFPEGGHLARMGEHCAIPNDGLAAYGITRETAAWGHGSVLAPAWAVMG